jgi:hypothetical protein
MCRQQATANSRNFRSLALPLSRRNTSIGVGSVAVSHSLSVIAPPSPHPAKPQQLTVPCVLGARALGLTSPYRPHRVAVLP